MMILVIMMVMMVVIMMLMMMVIILMTMMTTTPISSPLVLLLLSSSLSLQPSSTSSYLLNSLHIYCLCIPTAAVHFYFAHCGKVSWRTDQHDHDVALRFMTTTYIYGFTPSNSFITAIVPIIILIQLPSHTLSLYTYRCRTLLFRTLL